MFALICFLAGIFLIGVQTSLVAALPAWLPFYNLLIPYVIFLSLFRRASEALPQILWVGLVMGMISGAPSTVYLMVFIILFILFRNIKNYFQLVDSFLFVILIAVGVVIEHLVFGLISILQDLAVEPSLFTAYVVFIHFIWAVVTGPLLFAIFSRAFYAMDRYQAQRSEKLS